MRRISTLALTGIIGSLVVTTGLFVPIAHAQSPTTTVTRAPAQPTTAPRPQVGTPTTGINLTISPVFLNLVTNPGEPVSTTIKIRNNNNETENLRIQLARFAASENGTTTLVDVERSDPFQRWISYSEEEFIVTSNETKNIKVTLNPPKEAALGYYYALVISRVAETASGERQSVVAGSPAMPLLLEVRSPNAKREVQVTDFKTDSPFYEYLPTKFNISLKNTGNIHVSPIGDIFIDRGAKQDIAVIAVNSGKGNILPNTNRTFEATWEDGFAVRVPKLENGRPVTDANGKPVYETKYDFSKANKFRIGKYTANLLLIYDNGQRDIPLEATVSFWVIPWRMILAGLGIIIGPALLVFLLMRLGSRKRK